MIKFYQGYKIEKYQKLNSSIYLILFLKRGCRLYVRNNSLSISVFEKYWQFETNLGSFLKNIYCFFMKHKPLRFFFKRKEIFSKKNELITHFIYKSLEQKKLIFKGDNRGVLKFVEKAYCSSSKDKFKNEKKALTLVNSNLIPKVSEIKNEMLSITYAYVDNIIEADLNSICLLDIFLELQVSESQKLKHILDYKKIKELRLDEVLNNKEYVSDLPLFFIHGDVAPWNIRKDNTKFKLIDWEFFEESGFPIFDLFYYYYNYNYLIKKRTPQLEEFLSTSLFELYVKKLNLNNSQVFVCLLLSMEKYVHRYPKRKSLITRRFKKWIITKGSSHVG
jgi:hypothetical protein